MKTLLGTVLAVLAAPALAAVGSSASLTGLRYELVDLRPGDGIAPTIRYTGLSVAESFVTWDFCAHPAVCQRNEGGFADPTFSNARFENETGQASSFAAVSAAGLFAGGQYDNGDRTGSGNGRYLAEARHRGRAGGNPLFVLSAHTGVRITAQYTLDAWVIPTDVVEPIRRGYGAHAAVFFHSRFLDGPDVLEEIGTSRSFEHETGELSVLLSNHQDRTATVWGRWGVQAGGQVPLTIPEPSTWALLLAGAALVGTAARRQGLARRPSAPA
ncbi:PEPxxWA-CTERM sorting domain-containing protein [Azohydromonas aeria]|uniref:PEPxxWA-CTERM sorting domain-containing protein n=1 Tax=Azohydromonas aeria TaxID=2590212 RepID=UPI0012FCABEF|nr:PEPxxWA-CTERM sorting domain-containing protein [Azohydromonas aeria]